MSDPGTSLDRRENNTESGNDQLLDEIQRQREEILRLRDLLIGKDAELGHVKGRLTEVEDQIARYTRFLDRLRLRRIVAALGRRLARLRDQSR